tara:strand:+ start:152 stop:514 length:363 start_codon:yes stop_codon:yes gene_type:complete
MMRIPQILFGLGLILAVFVNWVQAEPRDISLGLSGQETLPLKLYQNESVKVSNSLQKNLYDLTITKRPFPQKILSLSEFVPGQSFDLNFPRVGDYELCFSKEKNEARTCLKVNVLKRTVA